MESHEAEWQVPGYTDVRELGRGGGGKVVLARHDADEAYVAIKYLSPHLHADTEFIQRFRAEAQLIATLDDPHTAKLYEYVEGDDGAAIVMEWVDGVTLRRLLVAEGATGPEAALLVLKGSLLALAAAHRIGIVHRDFKPENVMVTATGDSKLVDFGVATFSGETGHVTGTPPYMAPEQWQEAPAGPATDVYAATVVFFECLTGTRPFQADDMAALAHQHRTMPPPIERIQDPLRGLVQHGMAKNPEDRPSSAEVFLEELQESAVATYGSEWEQRGRLGLGALAASYMALSPLTQPVPTVGSSLAKTTLTPAVKLAVSGAVAVVTVAGVVGAFSIWNDSAPVTYTGARPPIARASLPPPTPVPAPATTPPPATETALPQPSSTTPAAIPQDTVGPRLPVPSPTTTSAPATSRAPKPTKPAPTQAPTHKPSTAPTSAPTKVPTTASTQPTAEPTAQPTVTSTPPPPPATTAPATSPPDNPDPPTAGAATNSLVKVDVSLSVGDLLDANVDVGLLDTTLDLGLNVGGQ